MANPVHTISRIITASIDSAVSALVLETGIKLTQPLSMVAISKVPKGEKDLE